MAESLRFVDLVQERIDGFLAERGAHLAEIADELADFPELAREFLSGGKRFRALFCYWGWQSIVALPREGAPVDEARGLGGARGTVETGGGSVDHGRVLPGSGGVPRSRAPRRRSHELGAGLSIHARCGHRQVPPHRPTRAGRAALRAGTVGPPR